METLEKSRVCRLCGKKSDISINIFTKNENYVKKINTILPIVVHEMDILPKHFCHRCSYKLEEFYKFYIECLRTDKNLKNKLPWMRKKDAERAVAVTSNGGKTIGIPMVHIENMKIEPPDYDDLYILDSSTTYIDEMDSAVHYPLNTRMPTIPHDPSNRMAFTAYSSCMCYCNNEKQHNERQLLDKAMSDTDILSIKATSVTPTKINSKISGSIQSIKDDHFKKNWQTRKSFTIDESRSCQRNERRVHRGRKKPLLLENILSSSNDSLNDNNSFASSISTPIPATMMLRNLRPRNNSVDYNSGVKRKIPSTASSSSSSIDHDLNQSLENNHVDRKSRSLRPRKVVNYLSCQNKRPRLCQYADDNREIHEDEMNKGNNLLIYGVKKESPTSGLNPLAMSANKNDNDFHKNPAPTLSNDVRIKSESCKSLSVRLRIDQDLIRDKKNRVSDIPFKLKDQFYQKNGGNNGTGKRLTRRKTNKICMSPKYLRSQDICLRSGRIKSAECVERSHDFRKNHRMSENRRINRNLFSIIKEGLSRNRNIKHLCDKCDIIFGNAELYRLHGCYNQ